MKRNVLKSLLVASVLVCAAPAALFAQEGKAKAKKQQIVITRSGDETGKTVIEIDGDKVKVNGKDAADLKDVNVHINNLKGSGVIALSPGAPSDFHFDFDQPSAMWKVDSNRAMLGVVTDGDDKGAEIQSISKGSAAEKAGLKKGDIITKIDSRKIETTDDVTEAVRAHKPGDKVSITYLRDEKEQKATAELGRWKGMNMTAVTTPRIFTDNAIRENIGQEFRRAMPNFQGSYFNRGTRLGMSVQDTDDGKGVKVLEIDDDGSAHKAGVKEGDIITHVDDAQVNDADEISKLMRAKKEQPFVKLQLTRDGKSQTISVRMKQPKTVDL